MIASDFFRFLNQVHCGLWILELEELLGGVEQVVELFLGGGDPGLFLLRRLPSDGFDQRFERFNLFEFHRLHIDIRKWWLGCLGRSPHCVVVPILGCARRWHRAVGYLKRIGPSTDRNRQQGPKFFLRPYSPGAIRGLPQLFNHGQSWIQPEGFLEKLLAPGQIPAEAEPQSAFNQLLGSGAAHSTSMPARCRRLLNSCSVRASCSIEWLTVATRLAPSAFRAVPRVFSTRFTASIPNSESARTCFTRGNNSSTWPTRSESSHFLASVSSDSPVSAIKSSCSDMMVCISSSVRPPDGVMMIEASCPVSLSLAETETIPSELMSNATSTCTCPRSAGRRLVRLNSPSSSFWWATSLSP